MIPEIVTAAADVAVALENGVAMSRRNQPPENPPPPAAPGAAAFGFSADAVLQFVGLVLLAFAVLAAAAVIHHGLTA